MTERRFPIVGIGASAGGVEALQGFFRAMPDDNGMAFVVVTHLGDQRESVLHEILAHCTGMPTLRVEDGMVPECEHVYVLSSSAIVTLEQGHLRLRRRRQGEERERNPIDIFFASLALDHRTHAIAVVLSGSGSDGTLGVKAIREQGGLSLAQSSEHSRPRHKSMPTTAIASGLIDLVLPVEEMPAKLVDYARSFEKLPEVDVADETATAGGHPDMAGVLAEIAGVLRDQTGHEFSGYKDKTLIRRVQRRLQILRLDGIESYLERLRHDPDEVTRLFHDLLIGVTSFFRDHEAFETLARKVIPRLFEGKNADDSVRVWVPGCATGEEVYSIAILLREHMDRVHNPPRVQVFGTDIDEPALTVARSGRYPSSLLDSVAPHRLERFFGGDEVIRHIVKEVRDQCVFSAHSVIRDPPFSRIDLISCRNVLIYFGAELQGRVMALMHYALRPGGFILLGSAENVSRHGALFTPVDQKQRIFQRRDDIQSSAHFPPFLPGDAKPSLPRYGGGSTPGSGIPSLRRTIEARMLEHHVPAHVVVDHEGEAVYFSARTGKYLEPAGGTPTRQLLTMARTGLRLDLRDLLRRAIETGRTQTSGRLLLELGDSVQVTTLTVEPLDTDGTDPLYLVVFTDIGPPTTREEAVAHVRVHPDEDTVASLERELRDTRERLQSSIEEHETAIEDLKSANEELVSVNEELQSANEELETSTEELQSTNEELLMVNVELYKTIEKLKRANDDLRNLFDSTEIAMIFLDCNAVIRSFTPTTQDIFRLIPNDRGRLLADIVSRLDYPDLVADIHTAMESGEIQERRVAQKGGERHYLVRLLPYRAEDGTIEGTVATFVDVSPLVAAELRQRNLVDELNHRVKNMLTVVSSLAHQTLARTPEPQAFVESFLGRLQALAATCEVLAREGWSHAPLRDILMHELRPFLDCENANVVASGPDVHLTPKAALAFGMVFHELVTNAVKHGALSTPEGRLEVDWAIEGGGDARRLVLHWRERDGPPVAPPPQPGFGLHLIEGELRYSIDGETRFDFTPEGLSATLEASFDRNLMSLGPER